jgi:DMSO/TMAO reductase YedYZ molybdopterin-dependent catalytic subunit
MKTAIERGSLATAFGLFFHYLCHYVFGIPLYTEIIGEWIMARTPNTYSVLLLETMGAWAKPFALTGGLFVLGLAMTILALAVRTKNERWSGLINSSVFVVVMVVFTFTFGYEATASSGFLFVDGLIRVWGPITFWAPACGALHELAPHVEKFSPSRRRLLSAVMSSTTLAVAVEGYLRDARLAARAAKPFDLWKFIPPLDNFHPLARKAITAVGIHYTMSKNSVDPTIDPATWRLRFKIHSYEFLSLSYLQLLQVKRQQRYVTLRCISNTLKSDLMGTAEWSGFPLRQIIDGTTLPPNTIEVAFIGIDGHGDSLPIEYALSDEVFLAIGMNGQSLTRAHGFPIRLLCPRYYGFKNVKWISEIRFLSRPYYGTWPKMGYTKEAKTNIASYIDKATPTEVVGVSFAGSRGIKAVQVRLLDSNGTPGEWQDATLENPLSPYCWTRWKIAIAAPNSTHAEARAQDSTGAWQATEETNLFPSGVAGPTVRKISV